LEKKVDDAIAGGVSSVALGSGSTSGTVTLSVNGTLQDTIYVPGLKGAAFLETGTTTSTVARGKHNHVANDITDFSGSVESVVNSSTTITNRIKNVVTSAITNDSSVSGAVKSIASAYTYDKNTIDTKIATHTHASSAVTSMANYSKASAAAAITTGDSLNVAIGKLEKKVDDAIAGGVSSVALGSGSTSGTVTLSVNGTLQDTIYVPGLKGAAFLETGTTTTTVARGKHNHVANDITDFSGSVESVVTSSTTVTNRIKNVIASAITSNTNVTSAITNVISSNTVVKNEIISAVTSSTEFTTVSGDVYTISGDVSTISGDVVTISGDVSTISGDVVTISGDVSTLKSFRDFMSGHNTTTSVASVPITKRLVIATISANASFSLNNTNLADGYELHVIVKNSGSNEITVTFPNSGKYVAVVSSIKIAGGKVGEINVISDGSKLYVRGA
jgi:hypothetical protein